MTAASLVLNLLLGFLGLAGLCLSMTRHHRTAFGVPSSRRMARLRVGGWTTIGLSLAAAIRFEGTALGPVQWIGTLSAAGLGLNILLSYRPRAIRWVGWAAIPSLVVAAVAFVVA